MLTGDSWERKEHTKQSYWLEEQTYYHEEPKAIQFKITYILKTI